MYKVFHYDCSKVHPRIRGEDIDTQYELTPGTGSPPHTRGRSGIRTARKRAIRFTPAYAGKINFRKPLGRAGWVHPRIRGEDRNSCRHDLRREGSPPHTRGRFSLLWRNSASLRFTPAYAGKIRPVAGCSPSSRVHPRIRGEDSSVKLIFHRVSGSPPHTRGRSWAAVLSVCMLRFTPAYAGKIGHARRMPLEHRVHPRIRGEDKSKD